MHIKLILLVSATCLVGCTLTASTGGQTATATTEKSQGFAARSIESSDADEDDEFESQAQTHLSYRQHHQQQQQQQQHRPIYDYSQSEEDQEEAPRQLYTNRNVKQQSNYLKQRPQSSEQETESEEEVEEPDRLSTLLAKSSFSCNSKTTGYYADESLACEVFHYCQDNQRHSWICPEGFTFHQIHLICMPPSNENICQQSSKYHIVNDYLYKPINLQEHQSKPNVTLRYSDRYFPESYYDQNRYEDEEDEEPRPRITHQRQPVQIGFNSQQHQIQRQPPPQPQPHPTAPPQIPQRQQQQYHQQTRQPVLQLRQQSVQQHQQAPTPIYRKPLITTTIQPQLAQLQPQTQHRPQTVAPPVTPTPYRFYSAAPQLQQLHPQQVFRTPEEINISLQQRRPQYFTVATTPRYYEDEYLYERRK